MDVGTENAIPEIRGWIQENVTGSREIPDDERQAAEDAAA